MCASKILFYNYKRNSKMYDTSEIINAKEET